jgi:hypothetical protein
MSAFGVRLSTFTEAVVTDLPVNAGHVNIRADAQHDVFNERLPERAAVDVNSPL